jgi:hypothetical protein
MFGKIFLCLINATAGWNGDCLIFIGLLLHYYFVSLIIFLLLVGALHSWTRSPDRSHASDQGFTIFHPLTPLYKKMHTSIYHPYTWSIYGPGSHGWFCVTSKPRCPLGALIFGILLLPPYLLTRWFTHTLSSRIVSLTSA